jgi:O-antigen ligase
MYKDFISRYITFRNAYLILIWVMVASLPLSKYLASATQILLVIVWLAEGNFSEKWRRIKASPQILIFTLIFFVPLVSMIYTTDIAWGLHDLKVKLPLFFMPLVLGSIKPLDKNELRAILGGFVVAVLIGALVSLSIMLGFGPAKYTSDRQTIIFISHIRFALMVVLAIFILFYYAFDQQTPARITFILVPCALSLIVFLFLLKSLTGVIILIIGGMLLALRWCLQQNDAMLRWFVIVGLATIPVLCGVYLSGRVSQFYTIRDDAGKRDQATVRGNPYWHDTTNLMIENGYRVGYYQCEPELRDAWNSVSKMDYAGRDRKGQELKYTLIRYLTSMGLRKDAYGVSQLKPEDLALIENGFANCIYKQPKRFSVRIYETIWEIDQYRKGANPSGHSVIQRIEYLKTGWAIFRDHPLFGVGTGDTRIAFDQKYTQTNSPLDPVWRQRAHNQFLTFLLAYGVVGFLLIISALVVPALVSRRKNSFFIMMFFLVTMLSMLNEDTLETQAGVAFFAIFYCLFIFADGSGGSTPLTPLKQGGISSGFPSETSPSRFQGGVGVGTSKL